MYIVPKSFGIDYIGILKMYCFFFMYQENKNCVQCSLSTVQKNQRNKNQKSLNDTKKFLMYCT